MYYIINIIIFICEGYSIIRIRTDGWIIRNVAWGSAQRINIVWLYAEPQTTQYNWFHTRHDEPAHPVTSDIIDVRAGFLYFNIDLSLGGRTVSTTSRSPFVYSFLTSLQANCCIPRNLAYKIPGIKGLYRETYTATSLSSHDKYYQRGWSQSWSFAILAIWASIIYYSLKSPWLVPLLMPPQPW